MYWLFIFFLLPISAYAFNVDSMVKYHNKDNYFVLTGDKKDSREYIYTTITELTTENGKNIEKEFMSSNISSWPVITEPSEIILGEDDKVRVKVDKTFENTKEDRVFGITFTPDLLGGGQGKKYNIGFGYKVWMVVPGNSPLKGDVSVVSGGVQGGYIINNNTNKFIEMDVNYCGNDPESSSCKGQLFIRPNSDKKLILEKKVKNVVFRFYINGDKNKEIKTISL
ncbi:hypothetical protein H9N62_004938 [Escherichia coli]|uniref:hypothetical protein n=1 Tax=Escherichia coli TaxID=562 RepID=UPI000BE5AAE5|nr:hypothetical protein [Escherichia coli]EFM8799895.1 hypothetical protein [Escherichia coli]EGC4773682.1 hypothetical protein [Escherichia coli]EGE7879362.1 hypothetical protein [Escherichia coli]EHN9960104.1 hypothetical protein [Escherichia coli]EHO1065090.1 hypothetical protein [Escherichia coli]